MRNFLNVIVICIAASILYGCVGLHNLSQAPIANSPVVSLSQNNFHVVKHVSSELKCVYIFGIGGYKKSQLEKNAVADMIQKANLSGSQTVVNIVAKTSRKIILVYEEVTLCVQGTVIEFDGPAVVSANIVSQPMIERELPAADVPEVDDSVEKSDEDIGVERFDEAAELSKVKGVYRRANEAETVRQLDDLSVELGNVRQTLSGHHVSMDLKKVLNDTEKYIKTKKAALAGR